MDDIRFGIGNPSVVKSSTWSLSASQANAYLIRRYKDEQLKFSLHSSGIWRFAQVSKQPRQALYKWNRPMPVLDSWVLGPTIIFSPFIPNISIKPLENYAKKINWLTPADENNIRMAMVAFSVDVSTPNDFLTRRCLPADWYSSLKITNDGRNKSDRVWIFSWVEPLLEFRRNQILDLTNGIKIHHRGTGESITASFYPILVHIAEETQAGLSPTFIDIMPSQSNLQREVD